MTLIGAALALFTGSYIILFFILMSWGGLMQSEQVLGLQRPMTKGHAFTALLAYAVTAGSFFLGGSVLLQGLP